ncbi:hypothetical protein CDQ83_13275 [Clostridium thermosuccinogenes]|nr:hypothetical protein CDQ83_13275 [Pseudoclostridium thermosuccinogenes]
MGVYTMEEISLRELIEILLKKKWIIVITTVVCMLAGAVLSFFVLDPVYEAKSTFMVTPISLASGINPNSTIIFSGDVESLDSTKELENKMLGSVLRQVRYPQISISKMVAYMKSTDYITKVLKEFDVDLEKYDYTENISISGNDQSNIISVSVKYNDADTAIGIKDALIAYLPECVIDEVNKQLNVSEDFLNQGIDREIQKMYSLKESLNGFGVELGEKDKLPVGKQEEYQRIYNDYLLSTQTLDAYQTVKKEFDNIKETDINEMLNLQVLTRDRMPLEPVSPRKMMNTAIAAILGLMISVFFVLFMEYWKESGLQVKNEKNNENISEV